MNHIASPITHHPVFPDLQGASVFITGGGSGLGAHLTEGFLRQGAKVAFIQRSETCVFAEKMAEETGNKPLAMQCDISDASQLKKTIAEAASIHGPVTVLVNNAANDRRHTTEDVDEAFWDWSMSINLKAYFFACQAALPAMRRAGGGSIINFSSVSYLKGNIGYPAYTTANAGITGLTRSLAREFGPDGIRVNALVRGWVQTKSQLEARADPEEDNSHHLQQQCLKHPLAPSDVVGGMLFLASKASSAMTGQALVIDGGVVSTG